MATDTRSSTGTTSTSTEGRYALIFTELEPGLARTVSSTAARRVASLCSRGSPTSSVERTKRSTCSSSRKTAGPRGVVWTLR